MKWYHTYLLHPGLHHTEATIIQHYYWTGIIAASQKKVTRYGVCQRTKRSAKKYSKLPAKMAEEILRNKLREDLIGPYRIRRKWKVLLILKYIKMIDPVTRWFEVTQ